MVIINYEDWYQICLFQISKYSKYGWITLVDYIINYTVDYTMNFIKDLIVDYTSELHNKLHDRLYIIGYTVEYIVNYTIDYIVLKYETFIIAYIILGIDNIFFM